MNNTYNILQVIRSQSARALLCVIALVGVMSAAGCSKHGTPAAKGDAVLFSAGLGGSESGTKTSYTDSNASDRSNAEDINWLSGDQIRIWCAECSEPTAESYGGADHWADYTVTPESTATQAKIAVNPGTVGLRWGETGVTHYFYAVYPSPKTPDKSSDAGTLGTDPEFTFTGHIPATQKISGSLTTEETKENDKTIKTTVAAPDMSNLYMVAKVNAQPNVGGSGVFLRFTPLTTAIQFTIENAMTADDAKMQVESVKIMSDPKEGTAKNLSGAFVADISGEWSKPEVTGPAQAGIIYTYSKTYPSCTEPADKSGQSSELTIDFKNTAAYTEGIAKGDRLQFTFFLLPTQSVDDLSFVITRKDGEGSKTIKTRLAMADGNGIPFPVHKKTYVKGILVPDSVQCEVLGLSRTSHYYKPKGESDENLKIMELIDRDHTEDGTKNLRLPKDLGSWL